ncbi:nucleotidyltransferase family protein [Wenxinia saemankumensis]|uniref:Nucleotidyltransferase family protein n=1 Tax=Wenxinia saemankumensis TaxID=1447782 RepID=A0A1M6E410_9RHOB|nr:nucleotidyltransferase family protein [Wenxinia saemankumensis]SHI80119.1 hypothetical protein SAMN05444417_1783 [Wenxinia saemankumensis]
MSHLRHSGTGGAAQRAALEGIVRASPVLMRVLSAIRETGLPDGWLVSGAVYQQVWNHLAGRPDLHGVRDIDVFCFDPDTSWDAEDARQRALAARLPPDPPVELRNQARVHLWYEARFGAPYPPLGSAREGIDNFALRTHAVGIRLAASGLEIHAPYGLEPIFAFRLVPNPLRASRATHEEKARRQKAIWPELTVEPWPQDAPEA